MSETIIEPVKTPSSAYEASIKIIGKFPLNNKQPHDDFSAYQKINLETHMGPYCPELAAKPEDYVPMPKKIFV